jgi:tetratricopeptide (TPR) repeat protein
MDLAKRIARGAVDGMTPDWLRGENPEIEPDWARATADRYRGYLFDTLGYVHLQSGETEKAIAALEEGASLVPYVDSELLTRLSTAYRIAGRLDDAIETLLTIVSVSKNDEAMERLEAFYIEKEGSTEGLAEWVEARRRATIEPAADFRMATMDGDTVSLSSLRGQVVFLNFWFPT